MVGFLKKKMYELLMLNQKNLLTSTKIEKVWKYHSEADHLFHQRFSFF